jgi:hypothetical protein
VALGHFYDVVFRDLADLHHAVYGMCQFEWVENKFSIKGDFVTVSVLHHRQNAGSRVAGAEHYPVSDGAHSHEGMLLVELGVKTCLKRGGSVQAKNAKTDFQ